MFHHKLFTPKPILPNIELSNKRQRDTYNNEDAVSYCNQRKAHFDDFYTKWSKFCIRFVESGKEVMFMSYRGIQSYFSQIYMQVIGSQCVVMHKI